MVHHPAYRSFKMSPLNVKHSVVDGRLVPALPRRSKVAIVGAGVGREVAPLHDETWEVWALNLIAPTDAFGALRADIWFDLHQRRAQSEHDLLWIRNCPMPIYVPEDLAAEGPNCISFPLEEVELVGPMACTFAFQLALALAHGFETVGLFGVELRYGTPRERTVEWASLNWWMGYLSARSVELVTPYGSWLGAHPALYGFEYAEEVAEVNAYLELMRKVDEREAKTSPRQSVGG